MNIWKSFHVLKYGRITKCYVMKYGMIYDKSDRDMIYQRYQDADLIGCFTHTIGNSKIFERFCVVLHFSEKMNFAQTAKSNKKLFASHWINCNFYLITYNALFAIKSCFWIDDWPEEVNSISSAFIHSAWKFWTFPNYSN